MKKLTLEDLKLESFLTELETTKLVKGGNGTTTEYNDPASDHNCDTYDECMESYGTHCDTGDNCPSYHGGDDCGHGMVTEGGVCMTEDDCVTLSAETYCANCDSEPGGTQYPGEGSASGQPCMGCH